jgi:hypothetical protein
MKKMLMTLFFVTCLALVMVGSAQAAEYTKTAQLSAPGYSSIIVTISNNVYMDYEGRGDGQAYGAYTKNKAGDKFFATGGGGGASTGIYFTQNDTFVGITGFTSVSPSSLFVYTSGNWTAQ